LAEDRSRRARAGQLVRMLDVPADRGFGFGAFDNAGPDGDPARLAKAFKNAAISAYGTAGPEFVRRLVAEGVTGEDLHGMVSTFAAGVVPAGADGQVDRAAQRLGLVMAAGELASDWGLTPWHQGGAREAAAWALRRWIELRGGTEPAEARQALEQVRLFIEQHGESRFESLEDGDARPVINRAGWRKGSGAERRWYVPPEIWRSEICNGLDAIFVARSLADRGLLATQPSGDLQSVVRVQGTAKRAYVLTAEILAGGEHAH
jgi:putative DNA primase/helicase